MGKAPPMKGWQTKIQTNDDEIQLWDRLYPYARNTGILCRYAPSLDVDILTDAAAEAVEALVRERFEGAGRVLIRTGRAPKRAVVFKCSEPFNKIFVDLVAPNDDGSQGERLELLASGQ